MTEIREYRGKRIDNGEWVFGDLVHSWIQTRKDNGKRITEIKWQSVDINMETWNEHEEVDPATIGQYTGLTDKNGTKIFEGDIIKWDAREWGSEFSEVVEWDYELFHIRISDWKEWCEVIGNIHDKEVE